MVDLHVHSNRSDGTMSPTELVDYAAEKGLSAFALTDHDTIDGLEEAMKHAEASANDAESFPEEQRTCCEAKSSSKAASKPLPTVPEIIPGIELSTDEKGQEVHVVGLFIDPKNEAFQEYLKEFVESRTLRNQKMCKKFSELGIDLPYEALCARFPDSILTRAHYARYLMERGHVKSIKEAFDRYLGDRCPCYVPREKITPYKAVDLILTAGGLPILAHPILYRMSDARLDALTANLKNAGLVGIEAIYSTYTPSEERQIRRLAAKYDLLISGGSDFHGANKPGLDLGTGYGKLYVPDDVLADLKQYRKIHRG